jgi:hypothetical protein
LTDSHTTSSRGNTTPGIVPPVLRTPNGLRQEPNQNGPDRPNRSGKLAAEEEISSKELEAI